MMYDIFYRISETARPVVTHIAMGVLEADRLFKARDCRKYDILDRPLDVLNFDGTLRTAHYGFEKDRNNHTRFCTTITDENKNKTDILKDTQGNIIQTRRYNAMERSTRTCYTYNALGELIRTEDGDGYATTYRYDLSGHCIERNHPDAGLTQWFYNNAGLLSRKVTARTRFTHDTVLYDYQYNRLSRIRYPYHTENNMVYRYKDGQPVFRSDGTGTETFSYDERGNVKHSHRRIIVPSETKAYGFTTKHHYDSSGRIRSIVYPNGDSVIYSYQWTGELKSVMHQTQQGGTDTLLKHISYNERGQEVKRIYGNGVETDYQYDTKTGRLTGIKTYTPHLILQDFKYKYDGVGNIIQTEQLADESGYSMPYSNSYEYDCLNRLVRVRPENGSLHEELEAWYSSAGRLGNSFCSHIGGCRDVRYGYDKKGLTHQPRVLFNDYANTTMDLYWERAGNLSQIHNMQNGDVRFHEWDEENRLCFAVDNKRAGQYGYDADGVRVWKLAGYSAQTQVNGSDKAFEVILDDKTLYPDPYVTIMPWYYTKHYYAGSSRIATALGNGGFGYSTDSGGECHAIDPLTPLERQRLQQRDRYYKQDYPFGYLGSEQTENCSMDGTGMPYKGKTTELEGMNVYIKENMLLSSLGDRLQPATNNGKEETFYTHADHLGTASTRTDSNGMPTEGRCYSAYGDLMWRKGNEKESMQERFSFTGKERDRETGYDYFGARYYYSQELGMWLSVDPLAHLYPDITPYAYCSWHPIKYVDLTDTQPIERRFRVSCMG